MIRGDWIGAAGRGARATEAARFVAYAAAAMGKTSLPGVRPLTVRGRQYARHSKAGRR